MATNGMENRDFKQMLTMEDEQERLCYLCDMNLTEDYYVSYGIKFCDEKCAKNHWLLADHKYG